MEHLTKETFLSKIFNYEKNQEWNLENDKPCIIDFYADWCQPCKIVAPILEELAKEYEGKLNIYKINTEEQPELSSVFNIKNIPTMLFCPKDGQPQMAVGALPKDVIVKAIKDVFNIENDDEKEVVEEAK
jgi:thioredoxin